MGIRVLGDELLREEPIPQLIAVGFGQRFCQTLHRKGSDPGGEVRVNRPASVLPNGRAEESKALERDRMRRKPGGD